MEFFPRNIDICLPDNVIKRGLFSLWQLHGEV